MKWCVCALCLGLGLVCGMAVKRRGAPLSPPVTGRSTAAEIPGPTSGAGGTGGEWSALMNRAASEALPDMETLRRKAKSGMPDPLDQVEWQLSLLREIGQKRDAGEPGKLLERGIAWWEGKPGISVVDSSSAFLCWSFGGQAPETALANLTANEMRTPVFAAWAERDPAAALKAAILDRSKAESDPVFGRLNQARNIVAVLSVIARSDPAEAVRLADEHRRDHEDLAGGVLGELAANSPQGALDFLMRPDNGLNAGRAATLLQGAVGALAAESGSFPAETLSMLAEHPEFATAAAGCLGFLAAKGEKAPPEALPIFEKLSDSARESALVSGLGVALFRSDPALADQVLAALPGDSAQRALEAAVNSAIQGLGFEHGPDTLLGLSIASRLSYERQYELADSWLRDGNFSAKGGEAWISSVTDPFWRDELAVKFAAEFQKSDPAAAMRLAENIGDPESRETAISGALAAWRTRDPEAAHAWETAAETR